MICVLVIAGVDSSGGAGLLRDTLTLAQQGVQVLCAVTAVTAQTHSGVLAVHHVPPPVIAEQVNAAFTNPHLSAVKIGMLGTAATVAALGDSLESNLRRKPHGKRIPIILDPVLHSSSGAALLDPDGRQAMLTRLFPIATLVTPNLLEAAALLDCAPARDEAEVVARATQLLTFGSTAVLMKGGHAAGDNAVDYLVSRPRQAGFAAVHRDHVHRFALPRLRTGRRGTGCTLASAIAAQLASGLSLEDACYEGKKYVHTWLSAGSAACAPT